MSTKLCKAPGRDRQAGFTLVELMVAMTGGLFLSIVVFALSRDATRFYQQELRVANATLSGITGFERLTNDIARAGHLVTPNINADPRVCNRPTGAWPALMQNLRALTINTLAPQVAGTEVAAAGVTPMTIDIAGALDMSEELTIAQVDSATNAVFIRLDTPAASRLGLSINATNAQNAQQLTALFMPNNVGRAVRITQVDGMEQYAVVQGVQPAPSPNVVLAVQPALAFRTNAPGAAQCGIQGFNTGGSLSIVNFVRYELRSLVADANYATLFRASGIGGTPGLPYESGRVELVRYELDPAGAQIPGTLEIISEYAVDLQFSVVQATSAINPLLIDTPVANITPNFASTQLLRGVRARLSVRSREADRLADVTGMGGSSTGLYRFPVGTGGAGPQFARVRTFQSDIALRNFEGANW